MENTPAFIEEESSSQRKILIVDDDPLTRALHRGLLAKRFEVLSAASGEEAIEICRKDVPDLILLDVEMPGMNGYEACQKLREFSGVPIIFVTAHQTLDEHLKAFDVGGDDIVTKPVVPELLSRKILLSIARKDAQERLSQEKNSLQHMAMNFLSSVGESGVLLNFMRKSLGSRSHEQLAENLVEAVREFGVECVAAIRHEGDAYLWTTHGASSALEASILEKSSAMGRVFQFKRNLVVNYDRVSIMSSNLPEGDEEKIGRIRDNITILAETTEALSENVSMRKESMARAENMQIALIGAVSAVESIRATQLAMMMDVRLLLQELNDSIEKSYSWLSTTNAQERALNEILHQSTQKILEVLEGGKHINEKFDEVLEALRGGGPQEGDIDLF